MAGMEDDFLKKARLSWELMARVIAEKGTLVNAAGKQVGVSPVELHKLDMIVSAGQGRELQRIGDALERIAEALEKEGETIH
jgi:hypothetical protein